MEFQRARNAEQKDIRINEILDAATELYDTTIFQNITMVSIAKKLNFSRANLYKYFSTKEEIYLYVMLREFNLWVKDLQDTYSKEPLLSEREFSRLWAETLFKHERFLQLYSINNTVLAKNSSVEILVTYRKKLYNFGIELKKILKNYIPYLTEQRLNYFLQCQLDYMVGLYPKTLLSVNQKKAIEISNIETINKNFVDSFSRFMEIILLGISNSSINL
jgi:AcrR family transcriptional regulator